MQVAYSVAREFLALYMCIGGILRVFHGDRVTFGVLMILSGILFFFINGLMKEHNK